MAIELQRADKYAAQIKAELEPMCAKIEPVGSVRRRRPFPNDIDFAVLPHPGQLQAIKFRCRRGRCSIISDGGQIFSFQCGEVRFDLNFAEPATEDLVDPWPGNWGSIMMLRTGSQSFNVYLVNRAKARGLRWATMIGIFRDKELIASETEEEIFAALGMRFVKPEEREIDPNTVRLGIPVADWEL